MNSLFSVVASQISLLIPSDATRLEREPLENNIPNLTK